MARNGPQKPRIELNLVAATSGPSATGRRYSDGAARFPQSLFLSLLKSEFCTSVYSRWNHQFYVTLLAVLRQFPRAIYRPVVHVCITSSRNPSSVEKPVHPHLNRGALTRGKKPRFEVHASPSSRPAETHDKHGKNPKCSQDSPFPKYAVKPIGCRASSRATTLQRSLLPFLERRRASFFAVQSGRNSRQSDLRSRARYLR